MASPTGPAVLCFRCRWPGQSGSSDVPPGVTLSRKGAKSQTHGRKVRSSGTKVRTRVGRMREPRAELERKLAEALEQQAATSEVLRVTSSSTGELEPAFEAILANATRLCEGKFGNLFLYERDGLRTVAAHNVPPAFAEARKRAQIIHPSDGNPLREVIKTKRMLHTADLHRRELTLNAIRRPSMRSSLAAFGPISLCRCSRTTNLLE
jgi:hypothetical protein